jgi:hypothetical protein
MGKMTIEEIETILSKKHPSALSEKQPAPPDGLYLINVLDEYKTFTL